jgi:hypothetical protein
MAMGICYTDHVAPSTRKKLALTLPTSGGRSVGIHCLQTKDTEFSFFMLLKEEWHFVSLPAFAVLQFRDEGGGQ